MNILDAIRVEGYGWIDFLGTPLSVLDAVEKLAAVAPELDAFFCSVEDWKRSNMRGDACVLMLATGRGKVMPDAFCPVGQLHGIKVPPKAPIEVGATLS